jgi:hypothetical protein
LIQNAGASPVGILTRDNREKFKYSIELLVRDFAAANIDPTKKSNQSSSRCD